MCLLGCCAVTMRQQNYVLDAEDHLKENDANRRRHSESVLFVLPSSIEVLIDISSRGFCASKNLLASRGLHAQVI